MKDKDRGIALELKNRLAGLVQLVDNLGTSRC